MHCDASFASWTLKISAPLSNAKMLSAVVPFRESSGEILRVLYIIEINNFKKINIKHRDAWLRTVWINSIFFPIAEISTSICIGLLVWYGGYNNLNGESISLGTLFLFISWFLPKKVVGRKSDNHKIKIFVLRVKFLKSFILIC